jgi:hypothetical protein
LSAEFNEPSAENSFGIYLERGSGVHSNLIFAARYYKQSAGYDHPDEANNLGFSLKHGRGIEQDFEAVAKYSTFERDHAYPEADLNYRHRFRILGHWNVPDRSSQIADSQPLDNLFTHLFIDSPSNPDSNPELKQSIQRLKSIMPNGPRLTVRETGGKLACRSSSDVAVKGESDGNLL